MMRYLFQCEHMAMAVYVVVVDGYGNSCDDGGGCIGGGCNGDVFKTKIPHTGDKESLNLCG